MKVNFFFKSLELILFLSIFSISCSKHSQKQMNGNLTEENKLKIGKNFYSVINYSSEIKANRLSLKNSELGWDIDEISADMNANDITELLDDLKSEFGGDLSSLTSEVKFIIIYSEPSLNNLEYSNFQALSVVTMDTACFTHRFYNIIDGNASLISKWTQTATFVYSFNFNYLGRKYCSANIGMAFFSSLNGMAYNKFPINNFNSEIVNDLNLTNGLLGPERGCQIGGSRCKTGLSECVGNKDGWHCKDQEGGDPGICLVAIATKVINTFSLSYSPFNLDTLYLIRDSVLGKYTYGSDYITQFYKIGYYADYFELINIYDISKTYDFIISTKKVLVKFLNPNSQEIPITHIYKIKAIDICNKYRTLSNNIYFKNIFDKFETDITRFEGMTVEDILNEIN